VWQISESLKKKKRGTDGEQIPYYSSLFGLVEDVTVERVITMLKRVVTDRDIRLRYACLALVDGFLLPTSHFYSTEFTCINNRTSKD